MNYKPVVTVGLLLLKARSLTQIELLVLYLSKLMSGDSHSNCLLSGTINIVISLILSYNQCNDPIQNQLNMINILFDYGKQPKHRFKYKHPGNSRQ